MLSKRDIFKELGKGINIVPLVEDNIKENSINVTISEYAWTMGEGTVCWGGGTRFCLDSNVPAGFRQQHAYTFRKGSKAIFNIKPKDKSVTKYVILLPHQTTIVETEEVLGLGKSIGGAVHSKVGIVAKGIGDMGTMLGPGYCGHLMLSLHNITDNVIALPIGSTIASLTFDELNTPVQRTSATFSSHYDKLLELRLKLSDEDKKYFSHDWKCNLDGVRMQMKETPAFERFKKKRRQVAFSAFKEWFTIPHILWAILILTIIVGLGLFAKHVDGKSSTIWTDRYWTILVASIIGFIVPKMLSNIFE